MKREREREREWWNQDMILEGIEARYDINYHLGNEVRTYRDAKVEWMVKSSECDVALERTMVHKERKCTWERERERERWTEELGKAKGLKISYRRVVGFAIINPSTFLQQFYNKSQVVSCYWFKFETNTKITFLSQQ